jgi:predicted RNase H-like HicB family nuclease
MKLPVIISRGEDGYYVAEVPVLPGCISQGKTRAEAYANIKEAAELCLESASDESTPFVIPAKAGIHQLNWQS